MEQDFSDFRPTRVWKRLTPERRLALAEPFWSDEQSTEQQAEAIAAIALRMKFRTKSVLALPLAKRPYVLVVLVRGIQEQKQSAALMASISRAIYARLNP